MHDEVPTTGGQYCVKGLVQQLLVGLDRGLTVIIDRTAHDIQVLVAATMTLEPQTGGDHQIETVGERIVEQVKSRSNGRPWTAGDISREVLPDLFKSVRDDAIPTRYRLVTDGDLDCGGLLELSARLRGRSVPDDPVAALDDQDRQAFLYARYCSEREYFLALTRYLGDKKADPNKKAELRRFWRLLAGFEAEGGVSEAALVDRIDAFLAEVVDAQEDVIGKRHELLSRMATLATRGGSVSAATLLNEAGLPVERLLHYARLPRILADDLARDLEGLGYDASDDVRDPPRAPGRDMLIFSGESGLGKSWRLAALLHAEASNGRLALLVTHARSVSNVRDKIIERVWHSGFDQRFSLPGLQRRLGRRFADPAGTWLTVGIDDVQDRDLLLALHDENWQRYGIRIAVTAPTRLADELERKPNAPADQRVQRFTRAQLRRLLKKHGQGAHELPGDVAELLCTPIFAKLYCRTFQPGWRPTNEYELIDGYWCHATYETRGMDVGQDAVVALKQAARQLLEPDGRYPWEIEDAKRAGLDDAARKKLVATGVLCASPTGISVAHDRVLNWLVARTLVYDLRRNLRTPTEVAQLIHRFDTPGTIAPGLAYRLGYVLLDLLWLGAGELPEQMLQNVIDQVLEAPDRRVQERTFIEQDLVGLGSRILPTLSLMATRAGAEYRERALHAARAIGRIGVHEPTAARTIVEQLLKGDDHAIDMGLAAAARLTVPQVIDRLWDIHVERWQSSARASKANRYEHFGPVTSSYKALKRTASEQLEWIEAKICHTTDALSAQILIELLLDADHDGASKVWYRCNEALITRIPKGREVLARAIGRFGDRGNAHLLDVAAKDPNRLEAVERFNALLRIDPERAVDRIDMLPTEFLGHPWYSLRRLVRHGGADAQARLLARHGSSWEAMRSLVLTYSNEVDLIDTVAFHAVIDALEARLAELSGTKWSSRGEYHLINFLSQTRRPDLLKTLRERRGSRFEAMLAKLATDRESRSSLNADYEGEQIERLLLLIGGEGYGALVSNAIIRDTMFARVDGYEAALRLPEGSPAIQGLREAVKADDRHERENYDLMVALATHRLDEPLYDLILETGCAYTDAVDIRASSGPWAPAIALRIRADLESTDSSVRIGAICALAFAPPEDTSDLLTETLARCPDTDSSAVTAVNIASRFQCYSPRMLSQLCRMLALPDPRIREAVLPYLAAVGDEEARAEVAQRFAAEPSPVTDDCALRSAYSLSAHETDTGPGLDRLKHFLDRPHGIYPSGLIAARLHERNAMTDGELVEFAYAAQRLSSESIAYLVERVSSFDRDEAHAIAEHYFTQTPSASCARLLLELGGEAGLNQLLSSYLGERRRRVRGILSRALRRHADRRHLLDKLAAFALSNSMDDKVAAAELLGWLRDSRSRELLNQLANDPIPEVADAALAAEARLDADDYARALIAELPEADHLGRWARLQAIVALADPYLLEADSDGLALGEVVEPLGKAFSIAVSRSIKTSKDALERDANRAERDLHD